MKLRLHLPGAAARLALHWHASSLPVFLHWWRQELLGILPNGVRETLVPTRCIRQAFWHQGVLVDEHGQRWVDGADDDSEHVLLLPTHLLLIRRITLPMAAARDLPAVLAFEIDKYTPFRAEQVYFATRRMDNDSRTELALCWVIILRERLDALLDQVGQRFDRVDGLDADGQPLNINLAPEPQRRPASHKWRTVNRVLALLAIVLAVVAMQSSLAQRQAALSAVQAQGSKLREQLQQLKTANHQDEKKQRSSLSIDARKRQTPALTAVLNDLSNCIPADTWLIQLDISAEGRVSLNGQSRQASELISRLNRCAWLADAQFQGAIQTDPSTSNEVFYISASMRHKEPDHASVQTP